MFSLADWFIAQPKWRTTIIWYLPWIVAFEIGGAYIFGVSWPLFIVAVIAIAIAYVVKILNIIAILVRGFRALNLSGE